MSSNFDQMLSFACFRPCQDVFVQFKLLQKKLSADNLILSLFCFVLFCFWFVPLVESFPVQQIYSIIIHLYDGGRNLNRGEKK